MPKSTISRPLPPVEYLHECFRYSPETGVLTWKERPREHFASVRGYRIFTTQCAGRPAGSKAKIGYLAIGLDYTLYYVHRIAWVLHHGAEPVNLIDHVNGIKDDNRIINLRDVTRSGNARNAAKCQRNTSGHNGIYWDASERKWAAQIGVNKKKHYLGRYADIADAIAARQRANEQFGFSPRHGQDMVHLPDS